MPTNRIKRNLVRCAGKVGVGPAILLASCVAPPSEMETAPRKDLSPTTQPAAEPLTLDASHIRPMYRTRLPIDLETLVRIALADNFDIRRAREEIKAFEGQEESIVGGAFPAIVPTALFEHVDGTVRATRGSLVNANFNTFQPSIAVQWVINPGRVVYEIAAARKRLSASVDRAEAVVQETLRQAAAEYYELVLAQARIAAAYQAVAEADELLRINRLRTRAGTGVPADELRASARLAERRQELALASHRFWDTSVNLAVTLDLDPSATLVPAIETLPPRRLVRGDIEIDELMGLAVRYRPDLQSVRTLVEAATAEEDATWWGGFGPGFQLGYQYGGITGHANNVKNNEGIPSNLIVNPASPTGSFGSSPLANGLIKEAIARGSDKRAGHDDQTFGFSDQQRFTAGVGWRFSLSAFGDLKTAEAVEEQAIIEAERLLVEVQAQVIRTQQASNTHNELIPLAQQQINAAKEALRLTEANLKAGTMTTLDVLQAQDSVAQARLRYAEAVVGYNQSQVNLLAALGLIDAATLTGSPNP